MQTLIDYSSKWLASNYLLGLVNLTLAILVKVLFLFLALKLTDIMQSGEFSEEPKSSKA